jgi:3-methyladenine DNA glycosylase AlkD
MSGSTLEAFEDYQKARVKFVQRVADLATRPQKIEELQSAGVMQLLRPLLLDIVPSIQQSAALALGRLANYSDDLAEDIVANDILPQLIFSLAAQNRFYKKAATFVLRSVAKHSPELATKVVESGALEPLVGCLEEFDPAVKEGAAWAIGYIASHSQELAHEVVDASAVPLLVLCIQEPEVSLKRVCASTLSDICKHTAELAQQVVDAGAVAYLVPLIQHKDEKLKRQVCMCLSQIAKHNVDLAEVVVEAEIFPSILRCLKDDNRGVCKNAASCIREVAKHTPEMAKLIVNAGGAAALVDYVLNTSRNDRLPGIMALGYIASFSETLALAIIVSKGVQPLKIALKTEKDDHIKAASAWSLGQVGRHSSDHARALAEADVLTELVTTMQSQESSDDLVRKSKRALKAIITKCTHYSALEVILEQTETGSMKKHILSQFNSLLPNDAKARKSFVRQGKLKLIQSLAEADEEMRDLVEKINKNYPPEIVQYYSPGYSKSLIDKIDNFSPEMQ